MRQVPEQQEALNAIHCLPNGKVLVSEMEKNNIRPMSNIRTNKVIINQVISQTYDNNFNNFRVSEIPNKSI